MTTFDKREDSFEKKFAHDEALRFRAEARRNKMLGLWAAEKLGKSGADAETYSKEVIAADVAEQGEEDVYRKLRRDFDAGRVDMSEHRIRRAISEFMTQAVAQIKAAAEPARLPSFWRAKLATWLDTPATSLLKPRRD